MSTTEAPAETPVYPNGVNVEALLGAREAFKGDTSLTKFQWRARNEWVDGTHSRTVIDDFTGVGGPQAHKAPQVHDADHPRAQLLRHNGLHAAWEGKLPDDVYGPRFVDFCAAKFKQLRPLQRWVVELCDEA